MTSGGKVRIYELSRDLGLDNRDVLNAAGSHAPGSEWHTTATCVAFVCLTACLIALGVTCAGAMRLLIVSWSACGRPSRYFKSVPSPCGVIQSATRLELPCFMDAAAERMCTSIPVMNASASDAYPPPARTGPCHQTRKDDDEEVEEAAEVADDITTPIIIRHVNTQL